MVITKDTFGQVELAIRTAVFGWSGMFSISLTILGGSVIGTESNLSGIFCVVAGLLTFLVMMFCFFTVGSLSGVGVSQKRGELGAALFLWILWSAVGGSAIIGSGFVGSCTRYASSEFGDVSACNDASAITVLGFLNGILYVFFIAFLLVSDRYRNIGASNLTAARINNTQRAVNNEVSPPKDCPSSV